MKRSLIFLFLFVFPGVVLAEEAAVIRRLEVEGLRRLHASALRPLLTVKEGDLFSPDEVTRSVKVLYGTGFFTQVDVESEGADGGIALTFVVRERPVIVDLLFEGNDTLGAAQLSENLASKTGALVDAQKVKDDVQKIKRLYEKEGYYNAEIVPEIKSLNDEQAAVIFRIDEGKPVRIGKVRFTGNRLFDDAVLQKQIQTAPHFWLTSWWTQRDRFQNETAAADVEKLRDFYFDRGYLQAKVDPPKVERVAESLEVTFAIEAGEQFKIGKIDLTGHTVFRTADLQPLVQSKAGEVANRGKVREDVARLMEFYGERGHLFSRVFPDWELREGNRVDLTYRITEGVPVSVREIHITGNDKTDDKTIRRELRFNEQEPVNTQLLRRSYQRLQNLNFFEEIAMQPTDVAPGWVDIDVAVKEKLTGVFSIGGNYSSTDKFGAVTDVTLGNFLGRGYLLRAKAEIGGRRTTYSLSFRNPALWDSEVSGTFDLFNQVRDFTSSYEEKRIGGGIRLGRPFGEYEHGSLSYTVENLDVFDVKKDAPQLIKDQEGESLTSALELSLSRDTRDFIYDPKEGGRLSLSMKYAGTFLGGDNDYTKVVGDWGRAVPLWWEHVLAIHGRIGYAAGLGDDTLPIGERFFVGGINTIRGFKFGKAGPIEKGEIVGGNKELFFNVEYLLPLIADAKIKGVLFYDYGRGFNDSERIGFSGLRQAAGIGIRWFSPIGPLRLEWGRNLNPREGESRDVQEFSIGSLF